MNILFFCKGTRKFSRQPSCESAAQLSALNQNDMMSLPVSQFAQSALETPELQADKSDDELLQSLSSFEVDPNSLNLPELASTMSARFDALSRGEITLVDWLDSLSDLKEQSLFPLNPASSDTMVSPMEIPDIKDIVEDVFPLQDANTQSHQPPALQPQSPFDEPFTLVEEGEEIENLLA